jgi:hypothetical protein
LLETAPKGARIFDHNDTAEKFYIILKGQVKIELPVEIPVLMKDQQERRQKFNEISKQINS